MIDGHSSDMVLENCFDFQCGPAHTLRVFSVLLAMVGYKLDVYAATQFAFSSHGNIISYVFP